MQPPDCPICGSTLDVKDSVRFIDVTRPIRPGMDVWPGDPAVEYTEVASVSRGDAANVTRLVMGSHTGTHVDAPSHLLERGMPVDTIPLEALIGPCQLALVQSRRIITAADLEALCLPAGVTRLLLKTEGAAPGGPPTVLSTGAARWIMDHGLRLVGVESLSVEEAGPDGSLPVHSALLSAGVVILEGLDLSGAPPGPYSLICLPMRLEGGDGAPARAILCKVESNH